MDAPAPLPARKTRIVATLGPASRAPRVLEELIRAGLDVARINFAHGTRDEHAATVRAVRDAAAAAGRPVTVFGDLPGPKIRVGEIAGGAVQLERGQAFALQAEPVVGDASRASVSFARLAEVVAPGDHISMNDGYLDLTVEAVDGAAVRCRVEVGGELRSHKGVNFPSADLGISAFTERDAELLAVAAELGLDAVSQSFVQDAADLRAVRDAATRIGYDPFLIAKIERARALERLDEILAETDAIMVARGDLGVETPIERMALVQKRVIAAANRAAVPVITATQMLESMTEHSRPTRAEATDVANAILDGTDCLMLSGETAVGAFPVAAVRTLARIAEEVEKAGVPRRVFPRTDGARWVDDADRRERLSTAAFRFIEGLEPAIVVAGTLSGSAPRLLGRFRIEPSIVAITTDERTRRRLAFSYGVHPVLVDDLSGPFDRLCRRVLEDLGIARGIALLLLPEEVSGDPGSQHLHILEL